MLGVAFPRSLSRLPCVSPALRKEWEVDCICESRISIRPKLGSEFYFQTQLNLTIGESVEDLSHELGSNVCVGKTEVGMVEDVEEFHPEFRVRLVEDGKTLDRGGVHIDEARPR